MHKARDTSGNAGSSNVIGSLKYWSKCFSEKSANLPALWKAFETLKLFAYLSSCVWLHSKKARSTSLRDMFAPCPNVRCGIPTSVPALLLANLPPPPFDLARPWPCQELWLPLHLLSPLDHWTS